MQNLIHPAFVFIQYFAASMVLLCGFIWVYIHFTPYREFELIAANNSAAAISLGGAVVGFTFPLVSSIYFTQSLLEMATWAVITGFIQLCVFSVMRKRAKQIEQGDVAPAIFLAFLSIAVGLLNAVCISH